MYERIKSLAKEHRLTIRQVEEAAGLGKNTLWRWKTRSPMIDKVFRVANVLGVTVDELVRP